jgi:hypothetical protein
MMCGLSYQGIHQQVSVIPSTASSTMSSCKNSPVPSGHYISRLRFTVYRHPSSPIPRWMPNPIRSPPRFNSIMRDQTPPPPFNSIVPGARRTLLLSLSIVAVVYSFGPLSHPKLFPSSKASFSWLQHRCTKSPLRKSPSA